MSRPPLYIVVSMLFGIIYILLMNHRIPQAKEVGFGRQGPKSKMAAMFVRGFSNFYPIAPILFILVSKV